jgi:hypothetical protein
MNINQEQKIMNTIKASTTKVVKTSRAFRVWIEGNNLNHAGFYPGSKYNLEYTETGMKLSISKDGSKTVSSCKRGDKVRPIIDLHSQEIGKHFDVGTVFNVEYFADCVIRFSIA